MVPKKLNTTPIYVMSVLGILCCCVGGLGFIFSGAAYIYANNKLKTYQANPEEYTNEKAINTAKIVALVILVINLLYLVMTIYQIYTVGWDQLMEQSREMMVQWGVEPPQ